MMNYEGREYLLNCQVEVGEAFCLPTRVIFQGNLEECRKVLNRVWNTYAIACIVDEAGGIWY